MKSRKSIKKSNRSEAIAREAFKRFSNASWALSLAEGDECTNPAPAETQSKLRAIFWAAANAETAATARVNLRNVAARYSLRRITKAQIPTIIARIRADFNR
jgi:hypothetical protein